MNKNLAYYIWSYLVTLGVALYFSKALGTVHPPIYLVLALAGLGLLLGLALLAAMKNKMGFVVFQVLQGGLAFLLAFYFFKTGWMAALAYPAGAVLGLIILWILAGNFSNTVSGVLLAGALAGGLAISLRLGEVPGGLFFALALLNGYFLGMSCFPDHQGARDIFPKALFFASVLAVGRGAIQYYLLTSNYAHLGVVITHPYTYLALCAGFFVPALAWATHQEKLLPDWLSVVLLGIALPLLLGVFIHVRPMAGFLLGLVTSSFLFGLMFRNSLLQGLIAYLAMAGVVWGYPLFLKVSNLSRWIRLEILGGIFLLALILFFLNGLKRRQDA